MNVVVANVASTLILCCRASLLASPSVLPASTAPWRGITPVRARIASRSVVLPLWNGPTNAMHRGPKDFIDLGLVPFCVMATSLTGRELDHPALGHHRLRQSPDWQGHNYVISGQGGERYCEFIFV